MLVKELIGKLNSYNMDAEVKFESGNQLEIELVDNEDEIITDGGNAKEIKIRIITEMDLTQPEEPIMPPMPPGEPTEPSNSDESSESE